MVYVFARKRGQQTVIVGLNAGRSEVTLDLDVHLMLPNGTPVRREWSDELCTVMDGHLRGITIPARTGSVWVGEQ